MADMVDTYSHKGYELVITYDSSLGLYEGQCTELGIFIQDISKGLLSSEFRKRVNQLT